MVRDRPVGSIDGASQKRRKGRYFTRIGIKTSCTITSSLTLADGLTFAGESCSGGRMKRTIWTGVLTAIVGFTAVIAAQTTSSPQSNTSSADKRVTVTGCLKPSPASTPATAAAGPGAAGVTGTAGTAGAAGTAEAAGDSSAVTFLLTNATLAPASSADASGAASPTGAPATGAPAAGATTSSAQTYRLIANPTALTPHIGKKVELTGTLEDQSSGTQSTGLGGSEASGPTLRVQSGKIVAESCSE